MHESLDTFKHYVKLHICPGEAGNEAGSPTWKKHTTGPIRGRKTKRKEEMPQVLIQVDPDHEYERIQSEGRWQTTYSQVYPNVLYY